jgi:hypothetical protein
MVVEMKGNPMTPSVSRQIPHMIEVAVTGGFGWVAKYFVRSLQKEWRGIKDQLKLIEQTTRVQTENHLTTIQTNTGKTNDLLEKVVENQIELNGWLKGRASRD